MIRQLGLDMGSSNTRIFDKEKGIALRSPTAVATQVAGGKTVAVGIDARRMFGKTPPELCALRPVQGGVVAEPEAASRMLKHYLGKLEAVSVMHRPDITVAIPCRINEVERRALEDTIYEAGARQVFMVDSPLAGAIGAGLKINSPRGSMIVDIGGGCSSAAVMSMGGVVMADTIRVGSGDLDRAIVQFIRKKYDLLIGEAAAEALKIKVGTAWRNFDRGAADVPGRDLGGGLTGSARVTSSDICEAIQDKLSLIIAMIKTTLEEIPPELASDVYDAGIVLIGGGSQLDGLPELLRRHLGIQATVAKNPADCTCRGIGWCLGNDAAKKYLKFRK
ncbi:MAG: rod shape-determining protein [Clostridia bacterium]|nr:rod shape-determining protein [Clostridia bacterium]